MFGKSSWIIYLCAGIVFLLFRLSNFTSKENINRDTNGDFGLTYSLLEQVSKKSEASIMYKNTCKKLGALREVKCNENINSFEACLISENFEFKAKYNQAVDKCIMQVLMSL